MIRSRYKTLIGKDLVVDIRSETNKNFEKLLVALLTPLTEYYAKLLHDAMAGIGTDEEVLIEVLCSLSNAEIRAIIEAYARSESFKDLILTVLHIFNFFFCFELYRSV